MQSHFSSGARNSAAHSLEAEFEAIVRHKHGDGQLKGWLKRGIASLIDFLTGQQTLSIRTKILKDGTAQWTVYDPACDHRQVFPSQQAVRTWLEQRYYH